MSMFLAPAARGGFFRVNLDTAMTSASICPRSSCWSGLRGSVDDVAPRQFLDLFSLDLLQSHLYSNSGLTQSISKHGALKEPSVGDPPRTGSAGQYTRNCC